ncbi:homoserine dehydrogenase [SAR202 cluster bacterium AD-802-E10_MRT_200m]|nr:homoserine dehydrogenase [SAR202 cluster bacterium AD-802-E10_MRT_200m]
MPGKSVTGIGILGLGVIGSRVARILSEQPTALTQHIKDDLEIVSVLVKDLQKHRSFPPPGVKITDDPEIILNHPDIQLIIEVMGGENPTVDYIKQAITAGKHVITANKEVIAKHGPDLLILARAFGTEVRFEAAVGAGLPILRSLQEDLLANDISSIHAIINGTTNYILTKMAHENLDFDSALRQAQELGFAETNPDNDVHGLDASYKLAILAMLAFHSKVEASDIYYEGITNLKVQDFEYAHELGYEIKLLAIAKKKGHTIQLRVHPTLVTQQSALANINGVNNAIQIQGDLVGSVVYSGEGAGSQSTASAILGDLISITKNQKINKARIPLNALSESDQISYISKKRFKIQPISELITRYYLRLNVADRVGVLAQIATVMGDHNISLASVIQKDADTKTNSAELVIATHPALEVELQAALQQLKTLGSVKEINNVIRVNPD